MLLAGMRQQELLALAKQNNLKSILAAWIFQAVFLYGYYRENMLIIYAREVASLSYKKLAKIIIKGVGGEGNISAVTHCLSRLRFELIDRNNTDTLHLKDERGIKGILYSGGQYMVVIGNKVERVYREIKNMIEKEDEKNKTTPVKQKKRGFADSFIYLWAFAGLIMIAFKIADIWEIINLSDRAYATIQTIAEGGIYIIPFLLFTKVKNKEIEQDFTKKANVYAPIKGRVISLKESNDPVFSSGKYGEGVAIMPETNLVVSAAEGRVESISQTKNSVTIISDEGVEIIIHIGINTSELKGKFFEVFVSEGDRVRVGDPIIEFEKNAIELRGYSLITSVVIANSSQYASIKKITDFALEQKPLIEIW